MSVIKDVNQAWVNFETIRPVIEDYIEKVNLPSLSVEDEGHVFEKIKNIRDIRNQLVKYSLALRFIKRFTRRSAQIQEENRQKEIAMILDLNQEKFKSLKTKDERDAVLASLLKPLPFDWKQADADVEETLLSVNILIQELQRAFQEYELIYNFQKTVSMGYLLSQASSKLNDVIQK